MSYRLWYGLLAVLLGACREEAKRADFLPLAERFIAASRERDTATLARLTSDTTVIQRALAIQEFERPLLEAAAGGLEWKNGDVIGDSAHTFYSVVTSKGREELGLNFAREGGSWRVYWVGVLSR